MGLSKASMSELIEEFLNRTNVQEIDCPNPHCSCKISLYNCSELWDEIKVDDVYTILVVKEE